MEISKEEWREVLGWPVYQISSRGRVRRDGRAVKRFVNDKGYLVFNAWHGGANKRLSVHREVLRAFTGDQPGMQVRHMDCRKRNCALSNLAWGTQADNEADKHRNGVKRRRFRKITPERARAIREAGGTIGAIATAYKVSPEMVRAIRNGRAWNAA